VYYKEFFGSVLPPSRSCVAVGLPDCHVMLDVLLFKNSGGFMRSNGNNSYKRNVLHVQGISNWAPVCVGPYSQANTLYSGLTFLAGQIGLIPYNMTLPKTWKKQLIQAWRNVASVIDALENHTINDVALGILIYLHPCVDDWDYVREISLDALEKNAGIVPGYVDEMPYKSSGRGKIDMFMICIPEMPLGALVEIEVISCTKKAIRALELKYFNTVTSCCEDDDVTSSSLWDCDLKCNMVTTPNIKYDVSIEVSCRYLERSVSIVSIHALNNNDTISLDTACHTIFKTLSQTIQQIHLSLDDILHLRIYYIPTCINLEDLKQALYFKLGVFGITAALTFVPVLGLREGVGFGMQVIVCNLKHLDTDIWVRAR